MLMLMMMILMVMKMLMILSLNDVDDDNMLTIVLFKQSWALIKCNKDAGDGHR